MRDVRIVARAPSEEMRGTTTIKNVVNRESRGVNAHEKFLLDGQVREDGSMRITKRYVVNNFLWQWLAQVTPFGIVGVWGGYDRFEGNFWMWKEEWC
jgi:hypothetical protein